MNPEDMNKVDNLIASQIGSLVLTNIRLQVIVERFQANEALLMAEIANRDATIAQLTPPPAATPAPEATPPRLATGSPNDAHG